MRTFGKATATTHVDVGVHADDGPLAGVERPGGTAAGHILGIEDVHADAELLVTGKPIKRRDHLDAMLKLRSKGTGTGPASERLRHLPYKAGSTSPSSRRFASCIATLYALMSAKASCSPGFVD